MKRRNLIILMVVMVLAFFFFSVDDETISFKEDYYRAINEELLEDKVLKEDEYTWSYFKEAQDKVDKILDEELQALLVGGSNYLSDKELAVMSSIYNKALDMGKRDSDGLGVIDDYLELVWKVNSIDELINEIPDLENELGIDILSNIEVMVDYKDNGKNIVYFVPVTYAFGVSSDYIVNTDYMTYKAYLRRACVQLWKSYGYDEKEARLVVGRVFDFYERIALESKLTSEFTNVASYYQIANLNEVRELLGEEYLSRRGLDNRDFYSIVDKGQYQYIINSLKEDNLGVWKEFIVTKILSSYASYGSSAYVEVVDNLNQDLLGIKKESTVDRQAINLVKNLFASELDKVYETKYLKEVQIEEVQKIVLEIKDVYKQRLKNNNWLSDTAISKALVKLDKMKIIVGSEEGVINYDIASKLDVSNEDLISDVIKIRKLVREADLSRLNSGKKINLVTQDVVNAYYQPLDNSIVIPVAFFELINDEASYYEKLGTMGMILAHEVTHAFDGNGALFDEFGNMNNWWLEEDKESFEKLQQKVSDYYSLYEVLDGKYIDGKMTVNENIADLGAIACIVDIASKKGAIDDDIREMFSSFAEIWASVESEEYMELLLLQDVHSPNKFRVNAVLSSIDEFYQVYDIYPWNDMWISTDKRVEIW